MRTTHRPTPKAVQQALEIMRRLAEPTPRERAEMDFAAAKRKMDEAARAVIDGADNAAELGNQALDALQAAQAELERLDAESANEKRGRL